jgi:hypothetical protein
MLQDVRGIDLRTAFVRKKRQVIAVADAIDDRPRQSVEDNPTLALLLSTDMELNTFNRGHLR